MAIKKIGIISLSLGILGETFVKHELELGLSRLEDMGIEVVFLPNALKGVDDLDIHPEKRAQDLLDAYKDNSIDMILCAIGGDDTYRLLPYLFDDNQLKKVVTDKPFLGFSDTTINHLMLNKLGIKSFYGQAFLPDICELSPNMLPYTEKYFKELIETGHISKIEPSQVWYSERTDFSEKALGTTTESFQNQGFQLLTGSSQFEGEILGGCLESLYDLFDNSRYADTVSLCQKYQLFPSLEEWRGKILLLETSEEKPDRHLFEKMIGVLKDFGIFDVISGLLIGKPQDEAHDQEYKEILLAQLGHMNLPIVTNINIGHATPRCIIPFGVATKVDVDKQVITFDWS
ncbi:S66 peptidase family protein [Streptococcus iniae]|uniref:Carboxypeptidase n=1 Tax=Streptococcus iniae TaxID=1346 RepID=A0A3L8GKH0_STRIN|nr:S66 peptidase family protein [Streptococcus iniae]AGM98833.1 MccC family protein [Streptococcus iniae SF1]AHY15792.1 carboxypeptidase [Streptococcus iniae]AHY17660.1 carboxypeptidase [Streptococcus iniae]AJG25957.1 carboxypeptidase [Streptococcus iniae]APD31832.1 carboxypeptidase [Streptococcus iniae]